MNFSGFVFVPQNGAGDFRIDKNTCSQLSGRNLFPASACEVAVKADCPAGVATSLLRITTDAQNSQRYDILVTCGP